MTSRTSASQFEVMVEYMERHGDLNKPGEGPHARLNAIGRWIELANALNLDMTGSGKPVEKWKKVWSDLKNNTKKKAAKINQHARGTGGGPACKLVLTELEQRVLNIAKPGPQKPLNYVQADAIAPDYSVVLEIVDETPQLPLSQQPSTSQTSNNWLPQSYQIPTPPPLPIVLTQTSALGRQPVVPSPPAPCPSAPSPPAPSPSASSPPAPSPSASSPPAPSQPTPPAPTSPKRRLPPASRTSTISPATTRRPRLRSPQSASPDRPRLRARRRQAPYPFERATSEFAAMELRRLELEVARTRLQHVRELRDLRALEVEQERNQLFSAIVNVAQSWLDYYRSRDSTEPLNTD